VWFPGWSRQYKIQAASNDAALTLEARRNLVVGFLVLHPFAYYAVYLCVQGRMDFSEEASPSAVETVLYLVGWHILFDTWFYWAHRACHRNQWLWKNVHMQHHKFEVSVSFAAAYAHPIEEVFVNFASTFVGPILFPGHVHTYILYMVLRFQVRARVHCPRQLLARTVSS
jgi:sterol desaturase/sphingolipid hydroxylase (fatty acid hydroxylase superfamily)